MIQVRIKWKSDDKEQSGVVIDTNRWSGSTYLVVVTDDNKIVEVEASIATVVR